MTKSTFILALMWLVSAAAQAQTPRLVRAVGEAVILLKPDLAKLHVGVVTQASTARDANVQNAARVEGVLTQLRQVLGPTADIQTTGYSLTPNYRYDRDQPPVLTGYTASNNLEVEITDLSLVGTVIDAATQAGANNVGGLQFTIKDQEPARLRVLGLAARQGRAHAEAIVTGLGGRIGSIVAASEGATFSPLPMRDAAPPVAATTPIETGLVQVRATVTIDAELLQ
jgi:uncharacterized protein